MGDQIYDYAFHRCAPEPTAEDPVVDVYVDLEIGGDGFSYRLRSGVEGTALVDQVLDANSDPSYVRDMLLHKLTLEAQKQLASSRMSKREIIRRLETSPTQFYRLMDQSNYRKSVDQMLRLLAVLDCDVEFVVRSRP